MLTYTTPILLTLLTWWLCTGILLLLNNLPSSTHKWSLLGASVLLLASLVSLEAVAAETSRSSAVLAFLQALAIWSWLEMTYLMGVLTGASKQPCPPGARGWNRFRLAIETSIYHEIAVVIMGGVIIATTWDSPNFFCALAYLTLWLMRWSAKLNLFLGVANVNEEWFPAHMRYLASYIKHRRMNLLFPFSILLATGVAIHWIGTAGSASTPHLQTGYTLVASLMCLAILEHGFLIFRVRDSALWNWALKAAMRYSANAIK